MRAVTKVNKATLSYDRLPKTSVIGLLFVMCYLIDTLYYYLDFCLLPLDTSERKSNV